MADLIRKSIEISTGGLLGKKKVTPKKKPRVMPDIEDEAIRMARKRSIARQQARGGRVSTILSGGYGG